ncbi:methyl-accepting chemotaxis protein [Desulfobulbus propionicus]
MNPFRRLNLSAKIGGGFGLLLLLFMVLALVARQGLFAVSGSVHEFERFVDSSSNLSLFHAQMLLLRMKVKDYYISHDQQSLRQYSDTMASMRRLLEEQRQRSNQAGQTEMLTRIEALTGRYHQVFGELTQSVDAADQLVGELRNLGNGMEKGLMQLLETGEAAKDAGILATTGQAIRSLLQARLCAQRFFTSTAQEDAHQVTAGIDRLRQLLGKMQESAGERLQERLPPLVTAADGYREGFGHLVQAVAARRTLYETTLVGLGAEMESLLAGLVKDTLENQLLLGASLNKRSTDTTRTVLGGAMLAIVLGGCFALLLTRSIVNPVRRTALFAETMAAGDLTTRLEIKQGDEIGMMVGALNQMAQRLGEMIREMVQGVGALSTASNELATVSRQLSAAAEETAQLSASATSATEEMKVAFFSVSAAITQSTENINIIASSTTEMTATVGDIAERAAKARQTAAIAVTQARSTTSKMRELGESARKIGQVTETITEISEQTNLLALNATIEAARVGGVGQGFAVVADEIKALAGQAGSATVTIRNQISDVQHTTTHAVAEIGQAAEIIHEIDALINAIASSVEEQSNTTGEISDNLSQASLGIAEINVNANRNTESVARIVQDIGEINHRTRQVGLGARQAHDHAENLAALSVQLRQLAHQFQV